MLNIEITDEGTTLTYKGATGAPQTKAVDLSDLVKVLSAGVSFDMGFLPIGTRYLGMKGDQIQIAVERPASSYPVSFQHGTTVREVGKVNFPAALFLFSITKASDTYYVGNSHVFAMRQDNIMLGLDGLYKFPSPNVFTDARICWGTNEDAIKNFKSLAAINGAVRRFFTAPFNSDLYSRNFVTKDFPWHEVGAESNTEAEAEKYLKALTAAPFNPAWLVQHQDAYKNFDSAIKTLFKSGG